MTFVNKNKIVNDPVHGFVSISYPIVFDLIEHPYFQRLRHIRQLGLTYLVYPGANHTRFQHAIGAMHLMETAISVLRAKGNNISDEEAEAASVAILLHDIGHGPFSHSLEYSIVQNTDHETIGKCFMHELNREFNGRLTLAIDIIENRYKKLFLHQLVSGQLDMDRMDYLRRDSFFSGVTEGAIGSERIIKMLNVVNDELVVEAKGIYSIEKFLIARRLMYWQVYLHKTVVAADQLLTNLLNRARELSLNGEDLWCSPAFAYFLRNNITEATFSLGKASLHTSEALKNFALLDDSDIMVAAKQWINHHDYVLSTLSDMLVNRKLPRVEMRTQPYSDVEIESKILNFGELHPALRDYGKFFVATGSVSNNAYRPSEESIKILYNNGQLLDVTEASDVLNAKALLQDVRKFFICYPKQ
jgi:HD superfamily phosphohydrolase